MENDVNTEDLEFWSDPHKIVYKIFYEYDNETKTFKDGEYRLVEFDEWDEFHQVDILRNAPLEKIFIMVDLIGGELENREKWEYSLLPY